MMLPVQPEPISAQTVDGSMATSLVPRLLRGWSKEPGTHCLRMLNYARILGLWKLTPQYHSLYHHIIIHCTHTIEVGEESGNEAKLVLPLTIQLYCFHTIPRHVTEFVCGHETLCTRLYSPLH